VVCRAEGTALSDALIVLRGVAAHDLRLLHCNAEVLLHKIDRRENGQKRVPLAAAPESALPQPARSAAAITATSIPERIRFAFFMSVAPFFACPPARAARKTAGADRSCLDYNKLILF